MSNENIRPVHYLSFGAGVNSMALAILLHRGEVAGVGDWIGIFADTGNEKDLTYGFIEEWAEPWFREIGRPLITVKPPETVLEKWQRNKVTGSRIFRSCTDHAKARPIAKYVKSHGGGVQLIGIDAGEAHRAKAIEGRRYPLVELDIDRDDCEEIIRSAAIPVPPKSGCWMCPFMRVKEVLDLAKNEPEKFQLIEELEGVAQKDKGHSLCHWKEKPASYWRERAHLEESQLGLGFVMESEPPCGCYDG